MTVVSAEVDLFVGLATLLALNGIGTYSATGAYADDAVGIVMGDVPQSPEQPITLTPYVVQDDAALNDSIIAVQVRLRGTLDPRTVLDRSAAIFDVFQGLKDLDFGGMHLALMWRQSSRLDGRDDAQRWLSAETYYCRVNWPTTNRTE